MSAHLIERFDVELVAGAAGRHLATEEALGTLLEGLLPVVEEVFDACDDAHTVLAIPELAIDLGAIPRNDFHAEAGRRLRAALEEALAEARLQAAGVAALAGHAPGFAAPDAALALRAPEEAQAARLAAFLATGRLAWHADVAQRATHERMLDSVLASGNPRLLAILAAMPARPAARRLAEQFPEHQLRALLRLAAPVHEQALLAFIGVAQDSVTARRERWAHVLHDVLFQAGGGPAATVPRAPRPLAPVPEGRAHADGTMADGAAGRRQGGAGAALAAFLRNGTLAAEDSQAGAAGMHGPALPAPVGLLQAVLAGPVGELRSVLGRALAHAGSARRLVEQFGPGELAAIVRRCAPGRATALLALLGEAGCSMAGLDFGPGEGAGPAGSGVVTAAMARAAWTVLLEACAREADPGIALVRRRIAAAMGTRRVTVRNRGGDTSGAGGMAEKRTSQEAPAGRLARLVAFLVTGRLGHGSDETRGIPALLDDVLAEPCAALQPTLRAAFARPGTLRRLVEQFTASQLSALVRHMSPLQWEALCALAAQAGIPAPAGGAGMECRQRVAWKHVLIATIRGDDRQVDIDALRNTIHAALASGAAAALVSEPMIAHTPRRERPTAMTGDALPAVAAVRAAAGKRGHGAARLAALTARCWQALLAASGAARPLPAFPQLCALAGVRQDGSETASAERDSPPRTAVPSAMHSWPDTDVAHRPPGGMPIRVADLVRLATFLATGRLAAPEDGAQAHVALLDTLLAAPSEALWRVLAAALAEPGSARRLTTQFPERQLRAILRHAAPADQAALWELIAAVGGAAGEGSVAILAARQEALREILSAALDAALSTVPSSRQALPDFGALRARLLAGQPGEDGDAAAAPALSTAAVPPAAVLLAHFLQPASGSASPAIAWSSLPERLLDWLLASDPEAARGVVAAAVRQPGQARRLACRLSETHLRALLPPQRHDLLAVVDGMYRIARAHRGYPLAARWGDVLEAALSDAPVPLWAARLAALPAAGGAAPTATTALPKPLEHCAAAKTPAWRLPSTAYRTRQAARILRGGGLRGPADASAASGPLDRLPSPAVAARPYGTTEGEALSATMPQGTAAIALLRHLLQAGRDEVPSAGRLSTQPDGLPAEEPAARAAVASPGSLPDLLPELLDWLVLKDGAAARATIAAAVRDPARARWLALHLSARQLRALLPPQRHDLAEAVDGMVRAARGHRGYPLAARWSAMLQASLLGEVLPVGAAARAGSTGAAAMMDPGSTGEWKRVGAPAPAAVVTPAAPGAVTAMNPAAAMVSVPPASSTSVAGAPPAAVPDPAAAPKPVATMASVMAPQPAASVVPTPSPAWRPPEGERRAAGAIRALLRLARQAREPDVPGGKKLERAARPGVVPESRRAATRPGDRFMARVEAECMELCRMLETRQPTVPTTLRETGPTSPLATPDDVRRMVLQALMANAPPSPPVQWRRLGEQWQALAPALRRVLRRPTLRAALAAGLPEPLLAALVDMLRPDPGNDGGQFSPAAQRHVDAAARAGGAASSHRTPVFRALAPARTAASSLASPPPAPAAQAGAGGPPAGLSRAPHGSSSVSPAAREPGRTGQGRTPYPVTGPSSGLRWPGTEPAAAPGIEPGERLVLANAGMVLAAPYLPRLFGVLGLVADRRFTDTAAAERAVHLLQFAATGQASTPEYQLPLNKLLCGLQPEAPVPLGIDIADAERATIESLLRAMIDRWGALGNTSIDGFRQSFLVRQGELSRGDEDWRLAVAPGPFDMLMDRLPWSFSLIRYPWMEQPLHVTWQRP